MPGRSATRKLARIFRFLLQVAKAGEMALHVPITKWGSKKSPLFCWLFFPTNPQGQSELLGERRRTRKPLFLRSTPIPLPGRSTGGAPRELAILGQNCLARIKKGDSGHFVS